MTEVATAIDDKYYYTRIVKYNNNWFIDNYTCTLTENKTTNTKSTR